MYRHYLTVISPVSISPVSRQAKRDAPPAAILERLEELKQSDTEMEQKNAETEQKKRRVAEEEFAPDWGGEDLEEQPGGEDPLEARIQAADRSRGALTREWNLTGQAPHKVGPRDSCKAPAGCEQDFPELLQAWLAARGLGVGDGKQLKRVADENGWQVYQRWLPPEVESEVRPGAASSTSLWRTAYHGTYWYALWSVMHSGVLAASCDESKGHEYLLGHPGVYCSPCLRTAWDYARPHVLFMDTVFHRVVIDLRVNTDRRTCGRKSGGEQWVFKSQDAVVVGFRVQVNSPPESGGERFLQWNPELEAIPEGCGMPDAIINERDFEENPWKDVDGTPCTVADLKSTWDWPGGFQKAWWKGDMFTALKEEQEQLKRRRARHPTSAQARIMVRY